MLGRLSPGRIPPENHIGRRDVGLLLHVGRDKAGFGFNSKARNRAWGNRDCRRIYDGARLVPSRSTPDCHEDPGTIFNRLLPTHCELGQLALRPPSAKTENENGSVLTLNSHPSTLNHLVASGAGHKAVAAQVMLILKAAFVRESLSTNTKHYEIQRSCAVGETTSISKRVSIYRHGAAEQHNPPETDFD